MCRLPVELMTRIIELTRQPLPEAGDETVTRKTLCQNELASFMRVSKVGISFVRCCQAELSGR
jgi:hypothetical protein